jgi:hypothetical protein
MRKPKEVIRDFSDGVKHEARLKLWLPCLEQLHNDLGRQLKYFTLPGPRAFDVVLWDMKGLLGSDGKGYPGVCFCESNPEHFAKAKSILGNTRGILGNFEEVILSPDRKKYEAFEAGFPYDVYNLDFCGTCFGKEGDPPVSKTFEAITKLIGRHANKHNPQPFLLFVTVKIDRAEMNHQVVEEFKCNILNNVLLDSSGSLGNLVGGNVETFASNNFEMFIMVSVPKSVAHQLVGARSRVIVKELRRCVYSRGSYQIGKFVMRMDRGKPSLVQFPSWYRDVVQSVSRADNIIKVVPSSVSEDTTNDLAGLLAKLADMEKLR